MTWLSRCVGILQPIGFITLVITCVAEVSEEEIKEMAPMAKEFVEAIENLL